MAKPGDNKSTIIVPGVIFIAALAVFLVMKKKEKDEREKKELEEMLGTPLETFGDTEAEELAKRVQDEAYVKYIEEQALKNFSFLGFLGKPYK